MTDKPNEKAGPARNRVTVTVLSAKPSSKSSPPKLGDPRRDSLLNSYRDIAKRGFGSTGMRLFVLLRRLLGLLAACYCVLTSINSGWWSLYTLYGVTDSSSTYEPYRAALIANYLGSATIEESRLAREILSGDTSPRSYTAYIESNVSVSRNGCSSVAAFNDGLYGDTFVRSNFADFVAKTSYNLTFLNDYELVLPVVDCSFSGIQVGDQTSARVYYVVRARKQPSKLIVLMFSMSTQD